MSSSRQKSYQMVVRRTLAIAAALSFLASMGTFVRSFFGLTIDKLGVWIFVFHGGIFLLLLPMVVVEYPAIKANAFFWKEFARGKPRWVCPGITVSFLFFVIFLVLFLVLSHASSPEIQNGEYVLTNHGDFVRVLSESEYLRLKGWELRFFASAWMCFYFILTMYWWFPRNRRLII
jgi:hypothetical protein